MDHRVSGWRLWRTFLRKFFQVLKAKSDDRGYLQYWTQYISPSVVRYVGGHVLGSFPIKFSFYEWWIPGTLPYEVLIFILHFNSSLIALRSSFEYRVLVYFSRFEMERQIGWRFIHRFFYKGHALNEYIILASAWYEWDLEETTEMLWVGVRVKPASGLRIGSSEDTFDQLNQLRLYYERCCFREFDIYIILGRREGWLG